MRHCVCPSVPGLKLMGDLMAAPPFVFGRLYQATQPNVVRGWRLEREGRDHVIRDTLLNVRQMSIHHVVVACRGAGLVDRILRMVCSFRTVHKVCNDFRQFLKLCFSVFEI